MVVLAAAITSRSGKLLLSRQYVDLSRIRIEGLLTAFPKLIGTEKQHTYVETDAVRYVYQPVEVLYVLLLTTKMSNIMEDLETLRLLSKVIPEFVPRFGVVDEKAVLEAAFDIIFSFDEVIDWGGYRENVNLQQVVSNIEMYSNEEILAKRVQELKMKEVDEQMRRKANMLKAAKGGDEKFGVLGAEVGKFMQKRGLGGLASDLGITSKNKGNVAAGFAGGISSANYQSATGDPGQRTPMGGGGLNFGGMGSGMSMGGFPGSSEPLAPTGQTATSARKGMSLGKSKKQDNLLEQMRLEGEMVDALPKAVKKSVTASSGGYMPPMEPVHLTTTEKLTLTVSRDGGVQNLEVKGDLMLAIADSERAAVRVGVRFGDNKKVQLRTHPKIDKNLFLQQNVLALKGDPSQKFPSQLEVLRWRFTSTNDSDVPINVICWPSEAGSDSRVNIEYELVKAEQLRSVIISIPLSVAGGQAPNIEQADGEWEFVQRTSTLEWRIPEINEDNSRGVMEFTTRAADPSSFFPVNVSFVSRETYAATEITGVQDAVSGEPVSFGQDVSLSTDEFIVV